MKTFFVTLLLFVSSFAFSQKIPQPYVVGSFNLMPAGYASTSVGFGGGFMWNAPHLVLDSFAGYDTGKKSDDNTVNNYSGHDRYLRAFVGLRHRKYYAGVGARWSQLDTTNYEKGGSAFESGSWHPEFGGGRDFSTKTSSLFMRIQTAYMFRASKEVTHYPDGTSCDGCGNGSQGGDITLWFPSPARSKGHLFAKINVVLFAYHDTITAPANVPLTLQQINNKHVADGTEYFVGWRF